MSTLNLIKELEAAVSSGTADGCRAALAYTTDLLIAGRYKDDEVWMFGEIIGLLAGEIESSARARLSERLARFARAPSNIVDRLAADDAIDVARPVLRHSDRISPDALLKVAQTRSQDHLIAIAQRRSLNEDVTDALLARGNRDVARTVAGNAGARFSESGFWNLVHRCENDVVLTLEVGARKDIPRLQFQKLIAKASDEAKSRLADIHPAAAETVCDVIASVTGAIQAKFGPATRDYFAAKRNVGELHRRGALTEDAVCEFAKARKVEEVIVALSLLCDLPVNIAERALNDDQGEMTLLVAKAAKLSWKGARALLLLHAGDGMSAHDLQAAQESYAILKVATARQVVSFYHEREGPRA